MNLIYHIVPVTDWKKYDSEQTYEATSLVTEGFIHLSQKDQVKGTLQRYYRHIPDLLLLHVDADRLVHPLKYEQATNGDLFPHLYGPLNKDAVVAIEQLF